MLFNELRVCFYEIRQKITLVLNDKKNVALISTVRYFKYAYVQYHLQNKNFGHFEYKLSEISPRREEKNIL